MDPVARARKALEMFHEVTGEGLDHTDNADGDETENRSSQGPEDERLSGIGTPHGGESPNESRQESGMASIEAEVDAPVQVSEEELEKKKKELEEEEARRRQRKENGEAQRRAFRPTIATVQDSSCLL
jgi:hypothetical protein